MSFFPSPQIAWLDRFTKEYQRSGREGKMNTDNKIVFERFYKKALPLAISAHARWFSILVWGANGHIVMLSSGFVCDVGLASDYLSVSMILLWIKQPEYTGSHLLMWGWQSSTGNWSDSILSLIQDIRVSRFFGVSLSWAVSRIVRSRSPSHTVYHAWLPLPMFEVWEKGM